MTTTEKLRAMLDERGVEHYDGTETTLWGYEPTGNGTGVYRIMADEVGKGKLVVRMLFKTPEQAVEATLGKGECDNIHEPPKDATFWPSPHFKCSECGATHISMDYVFYCPNCGRKVRA